MSKFNPKVFTGKRRVFQSVPGHCGVTRLWIWDEERREYVPPKYGKSFVARKPRNPLTKVREAEFFASLKEAWTWLHREIAELSTGPSEKIEVGLSIGHLIEAWKADRWPQLSEGTRILYANRLRAFEPFKDMLVETITASTVDKFFDHLKSREMRATYKSTRISFKKELKLFKTLLNWYLAMYDEAELVLPFKKRHTDMMVLCNKPQKSSQFMQSNQCQLFFRALNAQSSFYCGLATVQLEQIMRVSEVCAMKFSNLDLRNRTYRLCEHVIWPRKDGKPPYLAPGTKSDSDEKVIPLREQVLEVLSLMKKSSTSDLIFHDEGKLLTYRQVQSAYDRAFVAAGLPFRGTHVLRHTGATIFLNETGDTLALTQMGNWSNTDMALHYGKILKERAGAAVRAADEGRKLKLVQGDVP